MTLRADSSTSRLAYRSLWLMAVVLQLVLLSILLHRFAGLATPVALNLIAVGLAGAVAAATMSILSLVDIWRTGRRGTAAASATLVLAGLFFLWPAYLVGEAMSSPMLADVTTDASEPPSFAGLAAARGYGANPVTYAAATLGPLQAEAYPDIGPVIAPRPLGEAFAIAREVVRKAGLEIAVEAPPGVSSGEGLIAASETTLVMGFVDDVAVRVTGDDTFSRIDIRSQARYGVQDLGRNAERVRTLIRQLHMSLDASASASSVAAVDAEDTGDATSGKRKKKKLKKQANTSPEELVDPTMQQVRVQSGARRAQVQKVKPHKPAVRRRRGPLIDKLGR
jgi:uncharacterized protein (DUF1499 family)